jgi:hypothetical protein
LRSAHPQRSLGQGRRGLHLGVFVVAVEADRALRLWNSLGEANLDQRTQGQMCLNVCRRWLVVDNTATWAAARWLVWRVV